MDYASGIVDPENAESWRSWVRFMSSYKESASEHIRYIDLRNLMAHVLLSA